MWRDRLDHLHAERANGAASEPKAKRWRLSLSFSKKKIGLSKKSGITSSMSHTKAFNLLDKDSSGSISVSELKSALVKEGLSEVSEAEIQSLIDQVDANGDGELQLDEFEIFWELFQASCNEAAAPKQTTARSRAASLRTDGPPTRERNHSKYPALGRPVLMKIPGTATHRAEEPNKSSKSMEWF